MHSSLCPFLRRTCRRAVFSGDDVPRERQRGKSPREIPRRRSRQPGHDSKNRYNRYVNLQARNLCCCRSRYRGCVRVYDKYVSPELSNPYAFSRETSPCYHAESTPSLAVTRLAHHHRRYLRGPRGLHRRRDRDFSTPPCGSDRALRRPFPTSGPPTVSLFFLLCLE